MGYCYVCQDNCKIDTYHDYFDDSGDYQPSNLRDKYKWCPSTITCPKCGDYELDLIFWEAVCQLYTKESERDSYYNMLSYSHIKIVDEVTYEEKVDLIKKYLKKEITGKYFGDLVLSFYDVCECRIDYQDYKDYAPKNTNYFTDKIVLDYMSKKIMEGLDTQYYKNNGKWNISEYRKDYYMTNSFENMPESEINKIKAKITRCKCASLKIWRCVLSLKEN